MSTFVVFGNLDQRFDRLCQTVIDNVDLIPRPLSIQAGPNYVTFRSVFNSDDIYCFDYCSPQRFETLISNAKIVICHGGVGVINQCLSKGKFPAVMARSGKLGEHIDDHQNDYLDYYRNSKSFYQITDKADLNSFLQKKLYQERPERTKLYSEDKLIADVRSTIVQFLREA